MKPIDLGDKCKNCLCSRCYINLNDDCPMRLEGEQCNTECIYDDKKPVDDCLLFDPIDEYERHEE